MENNENNSINNPNNKEQNITLKNRQNLIVSGTTKIISLKPDLIQLNTELGGLIIGGSNLELLKLDNVTNIAEINGNINLIKYVEGKSKEPFFRKIFKWYL